MCRVCENVQEGDFAVFSLDDWCSSSVFLIGMLYGLGSRVILLKNDSLQPVPLTEYVDYDLVRYGSVGELKANIMEHLMPYIRPSQREASSQ